MSTATVLGASCFARLVGESERIRSLRVQLDALGRRRCTTLLQGESGTGKELAARCIHDLSDRAGRPFVPVDCTTLRDTLLESQLFGHVRGAFSGADRPTLGFIRAADGGTLFLDEIGELPLPSQAKLLRCIQEGMVTPLGATSGIAVDVRVIAATHRDLAAMVSRGEFREDLFYRLNVARLRLPPLRERRDDIRLLVAHALEKLSKIYREPERRVSSLAMEALLAHDWPGNVRELINAIEHAMVFNTNDADEIQFEDLPEEIREAVVIAPTRILAPSIPMMPLETAERCLIEAALHASGGNQSRAAEMLVIERHRLRRRIVHHGLSGLLRSR